MSTATMPPAMNPHSRIVFDGVMAALDHAEMLDNATDYAALMDAIVAECQARKKNAEAAS